MVRLTPNGLSVRERQRAISFVRSCGVGWGSAVMKPSAPALATAATSSARPTHCIPPCTIGCSTPTSSVNRVLIILTPDGFPGAVTFAHALIFRIFRRQDAVASGKCPLARGCEVLPGFGWRNSNADHRRLRVLPEQGA